MRFITESLLKAKLHRVAKEDTYILQRHSLCLCRWVSRYLGIIFRTVISSHLGQEKVNKDSIQKGQTDQDDPKLVADAGKGGGLSVGSKSKRLS